MGSSDGESVQEISLSLSLPEQVCVCVCVCVCVWCTAMKAVCEWVMKASEEQKHHTANLDQISLEMGST